MDIMRKISLLIILTYVAACGGGGGNTITQNVQIAQTTAKSTDTDTSSQPAFSNTSSIGETGQIYVLDRLSLGPEKRLSTWANETYDAQITLDNVLIDANGTIYGKPTPNPAAILEFTANGTAMGYLVYGDHAYQLESGNVALSLNAAQGGTLTLDRFNVIPLGAGQPDLGGLTIDVSNIAYLGACGSADFCSNAAHYAFTSTGSIPDGTTATGRILGGVFGPNGENAGALLDASNANTVEFRGDFVARRNP
jgi:hypothetical protein